MTITVVQLAFRLTTQLETRGVMCDVSPPSHPCNDNATEGKFKLWEFEIDLRLPSEPKLHRAIEARRKEGGVCRREGLKVILEVNSP